MSILGIRKYQFIVRVILGEIIKKEYEGIGLAYSRDPEGNIIEIQKWKNRMLNWSSIKQNETSILITGNEIGAGYCRELPGIHIMSSWGL